MTESIHRSSGFHQIIRNGFSNLIMLRVAEQTRRNLRAQFLNAPKERTKYQSKESLDKPSNIREMGLLFCAFTPK